MVVKDINELRDRIHASCATIGNFDGVHLGHQKLIARVRDRARILKISSVVITFDPHPLRVLVDKKTPPFITLTEQKLELISKLEVDYVLCIKFTKDLAALKPEEFVQKYLVNGLKLKELIIGYDYAFGKGRRGNFELLNKLGEKFGFAVEQLSPVMVDGAIVSSTRIRDMVQAGMVWEARKLLGRFYRVQGKVITGQKRGGPLLGFPTANICLKDELFPKTGVYAVWVEVLGQVYPGVANIGYNPTFGNDYLSVEAHILNFKQNIYGQDIRVHFVQRLRSEKKFSGLNELKKQIQADIELGQKILNSPEAQLS
jgi:riboflavin kinase/FMN adenylyltransferase